MHAHETSKDNTDNPLQQSTTRQMTGRIMQLTGAVRPELMLSLQLSETWDDHHPAGKGTVRLVSTMFGAWKPTAACPTPRLWILLCGHYRTFSWARSSLAEVANLSSADCYFIFAAIPLQIESVARTGSWSPVAGTLYAEDAKDVLFELRVPASQRASMVCILCSTSRCPSSTAGWRLRFSTAPTSSTEDRVPPRLCCGMQHGHSPGCAPSNTIGAPSTRLLSWFEHGPMWCCEHPLPSIGFSDTPAWADTAGT